MMRLPRWRGWDVEVSGRALRLLVIAALLALGAAAHPTPTLLDSVPQVSWADSAPIAAFAPSRADSIKNLIAQPPIKHLNAAVMTVASRKTYRRSSQIELAINDLRNHDLLIPLPDLTPSQLRDSFDEARDAGARRHRAIDIHAPRGTPILSVDNGAVVKLHESRSGGISLYATDSRERFIYFYAHLDSYHPNMRDGLPLSRGDTIGYVGTTGNAPPNTPHLHFAILRASSLARWSSGMPINPFKVFR